MRVVALVPGGIGEQILLFPTLDDLKRSYPNAQIDVVVEPRSKAAYRVSKSVNEVLSFDFRDRNSLADWSNLVGIIRDREYDVAITIGRSWLVGLLLWLTGIPTRIGYQGKGAAFLTKTLPYNPAQYLPALYHNLLQGFGIQSSCPELAVNVPKPDIEWAQKEQLRLGVNETGYVLIHPGSSQLSPIYPASSWQQIIQEFQQKQPDLPIVLVQTVEDEPIVRSLLESCHHLKVTAPGNIGKLAAIVGGASLLLTTDSIALQLSVAVQTYTIALFGDTEPAQLLPQSEKFLGIKSATGKLADIPPKVILEKVLGG